VSAESGSRLAEELRLLVEAVADRAGPWLDQVVSAEQQESCSWCPLCAAVALVRGRPNALAGRGLDAAADVVALLRAVLADRWEPGASHQPGFTPEEKASTKVQHIPVRRERR
jgi:hypothetical protein